MNKKIKLGAVKRNYNGYIVRHMPHGSKGFGIYLGKRLVKGGFNSVLDATKTIIAGI